MTTLNTPGGMSVCSATILPMKVALYGVSGAGFSTTVQPAASAGVIFDRLSMNGKFHGVIAPTTPIGSFTISRFDRMPKNSCSPSSYSHWYRSIISMSQSMSSMQVSCWIAKVSAIGVPTSATICGRSVSRSFASASWSCIRHRLRSSRSVAHALSSNARRAAAMALSMSAGPGVGDGADDLLGRRVDVVVGRPASPRRRACRR